MLCESLIICVGYQIKIILGLSEGFGHGNLVGIALGLIFVETLGSAEDCTDSVRHREYMVLIYVKIRLIRRDRAGGQ